MGARAAIAAAAVELIAEGGGLEAVSVRLVAARARVSPGLVQHHYRTKQQLLIAAMDLVGQRVRARLVQAGGDLSQPADQLTRLVRELLPLDDQRRTEARVWLAFVARAGVDAEVAARHATEWHALQDSFATLFRACRTPGPDDSGDREDPNQDERDRDDAALLMATLDGLTIAAVAEGDRAGDRMGGTRLEALAQQLVARHLAATSERSAAAGCRPDPERE